MKVGVTERRGRGGQDERGSTLLISVAILGLLFFFALIFARLVRFERIASQNYTDAVRARLLARAGIQRSVRELQEVALKRHYSSPGADKWGFGLQAPAALGNSPLDLHSTTTPSFAETDSRFQYYGQDLVYSGTLGASYGDRSIDIYRLKIKDCPSMVNMNNPDPAAARRMLKNLLRACFPRLDSTSDILPAGSPARTMANRVVDQRPLSGFRSKSEVQALLMNNGSSSATATDRLSLGEWAVISDMITVHGWKDENSVRPWAANSVSGDLDSTADLETPQRQLAPQPRSPINLNTAPFPVLVALFADAKAVSPRFGSFRIRYEGARMLAASIIQYRNHFGAFKTWREFENFIDASDSVVEAYMTSVGKSMNGLFNENSTRWQVTLNSPAAPTAGAVLNEVPSAASSGGGATTLNPDSLEGTALRPSGAGSRNQGIRDLIKAICNPNTMVSKFGMLPTHGGGFAPPLTSGRQLTRIPRLIDKTDVTSMTTDACFDAMGYYEITSMGMLLMADERTANGLLVLAAQVEQAVVQVYNVLRLTTQQDFERHRAFMVPGNFSAAFDRDWGYTDATQLRPGTSTYWRYGVNKAVYGPKGNPYVTGVQGFQGWPGMLTGPVYSMSRQPGAQLYEMESTPAPWDGYLSLTNLTAYQIQNEDFLVGFARGKLDAFKVRSWYEPKDQDPDGQPLGTAARTLDPTAPAPLSPTHPADDWKRSSETNIATGAGTTAAGGAVAASDDMDPTLSGEVYTLAKPHVDSTARLPRFAANDMGRGSEASPLDENPGDVGTLAPGMWTEGSALWNTGVAVQGVRTYDDGGVQKPRFLVYNGNNLDLVRGTSIRMWVQPLSDPYLRKEEVLLSFVGSNGGSSTPDRAASGSPTRDNGTVQNADAREVGFRLVKKVYGADVMIELQAYPPGQASWADPQGASSVPTIQLDVTPDSGTHNPVTPEWIPGSWHWVVLNFGMNMDATGTTVFTATLQVDMAQSWNSSTGILGFRGDNRDGYGEMHGYQNASTGALPTAYDRTYLGRWSPSGTIYWYGPQLLGDWYHCDAGDSSGGGGSYDTTDDDQTWQNAVRWDASQSKYLPTSNWPAAPFPAGSFNHKMTLIFVDDPSISSNTGSPPSPANMRSGGGGGGGGGGNGNGNGNGGGGSNPAVSGGDNLGGNWSHTFTDEEMGSDDAPGGAEWRIDLKASWTTASFTPGTGGGTGACTCCTSCDHDSKGPIAPGPGYNGYNLGYNTGTGKCCWVVHTMDGYVTSPRASFDMTHRSPPPSPTPLDHVCDDCHGCERCDVDGPVFFGGEPGPYPFEAHSPWTQYFNGNGLLFRINGPRGSAGAYSLGNYGGGTNVHDAAPQGVNPATVANCVFDNIFFANRMAARTDFPGFTTSDGTYIPPGKEFEDRFFETNMSYAMGLSSPGYGAVYHRGLLELIGQRGVLGTMTWTSYPSVEGLDYELALWEVPNAMTGFNDGTAKPVFHMDNVGIIADSTGAERTPDFGRLDTSGATWSVVGYTSEPSGGQAHGGAGFQFFRRIYDGVGDSSLGQEPSLLLLGVRMGGMPVIAGAGSGDPTAYGTDPNAGRTQYDTGGAGLTGTGIPQPNLSTPVLEDVTITVLLERPQFIYAEEGGEEGGLDVGVPTYVNGSAPATGSGGTYTSYYGYNVSIFPTAAPCPTGSASVATSPSAVFSPSPSPSYYYDPTVYPTFGYPIFPY